MDCLKVVFCFVSDGFSSRRVGEDVRYTCRICGKVFNRAGLFISPYNHFPYGKVFLSTSSVVNHSCRIKETRSSEKKLALKGI